MLNGNVSKSPRIILVMEKDGTTSDGLQNVWLLVNHRVFVRSHLLPETVKPCGGRFSYEFLSPRVVESEMVDLTKAGCGRIHRNEKDLKKMVPLVLKCQLAFIKETFLNLKVVPTYFWQPSGKHRPLRGPDREGRHPERYPSEGPRCAVGG